MAVATIVTAVQTRHLPVTNCYATSYVRGDASLVGYSRAVRTDDVLDGSGTTGTDLTAAVQRSLMPSTTWHVLTGTLVVAVLAYSVLLAQHPLLGVVVASLLYLLSWLAVTADVAVGAAFSRTRGALTVVVALLTMAYAVLIAQQILLGLFAVVLIVVVSWATSPHGPLARLFGPT